MVLDFPAFRACLPPYLRREYHTFGPFTFNVTYAHYLMYLRKPYPVDLPTLRMYALVVEHAGIQHEGVPPPDRRVDINRPLLIATARLGAYTHVSQRTGQPTIRFIERQFLVDGRVRIVTAHAHRITPLQGFILTAQETQLICPELLRITQGTAPLDNAVDAFADPFAASIFHLPDSPWVEDEE